MLSNYCVREELAAGKSLADIARELEAKVEQRNADRTCNGLLSRELADIASRLRPVVFVGKHAAGQARQRIVVLD